jgi:MFS family permease
MTRILESLTVLRNRNVRRLALALSFAETSAPAYAAALFVYAYGEGRGSGVGLVGLATLVPTALAAPLAGSLPDRFPPQRVLLASALVRGAALVAVAAAMATGASLFVIALLAAIGSAAARAYRPAQMALLPALTGSERELAAANAICGAVENAGTVAGPAIGGLLLLVVGAPAATAACALGALASGVAACSIRDCTRQSRGPRSGLDLLGGVRAITSTPPLRLVVCLFAAQTLIFGVFAVLTVELALTELAAGPGAVGLLNGMVGAGGLAGAVAVLALSGRAGLGRQLCLGTLGWGAPLAVLAATPTLTGAVLAFLSVGVGNVVVDVSAYTLIQRATPDGALGRVFGALEGLCVACGGLGAGLGGLAIDVFGARATLGALGVALVGVAAGSLGALDRLDDSVCRRDDGPGVRRVGDPDPATS